MTLTTAEKDAIRHHLGYGNLSVVSLPYTGDLFWSQVDFVSSYLDTGAETSATTEVTAGSTTVVTPVAMTGITVYGQLVVGVADEAEVVMVSASTVSTFTASFAKDHATTGYPIATMSGLARLRLLLWDADKAWREISDPATSSSAGLQSVDKGDVVWFSGFRVLSDKLSHYMAIANQISHLTRIQVNWKDTGRRASRLCL